MLLTQQISTKILEEAVAEAQATLAPQSNPIAQVAHKIVDDYPGIDGNLRELFHKLVDAQMGPREAQAPVQTKTAEPVVESGYRPGMIVVPLDNPNSHNYQLGHPVLVVKCEGCEAYALNPDGSVGNLLPDYEDYPASVRVASQQEIDEFYRRLKQLTGESSVLALL